MIWKKKENIFWSIFNLNKSWKDLEKLDLEMESCIWRNHFTYSLFPISIIRRTNQIHLLTLAKLHHSLIPSSNHLPNTNIKFKWHLSVYRRIKHFSIRESTMIVDFHLASLFGEIFAISRSNSLDLHLAKFKQI